MVTTGGKGGGEIDWEIGVDIYTLLHTKQTTNKNLLYSMESFIQHSVMSYTGIASKTEGIYVHI